MRLLVLLSILLIAGCGARAGIVVSDLELAHKGWETLEVSVTFASKTTLGGFNPLVGSKQRIVAFNTSYDTLYAGSDSVFAIQDIDLGNEERILVEVCGEVKQLIVCEQATTLASPKRVNLEPDIEYPLRKKVFEGEYKLPFVVQRMVGENEWETIKPSSTIQGYLKTYVAGQEDAAIHIPFTSQRGGFNLANLRNWKDFKYYMDVALMREKAASVMFDIYVDLEGVSEAVASVEKGIEMKSDDEHKEDIALYAEQAGEEIVDYLSPFLRRDRNTVYIDRWTYNPFKKTYSIEMEVEWQGTMFNRSTYRLSGVLEVDETGEKASFRYVEGNRRASQRWEARVDGNVLNLFGANNAAAPTQQMAGPHREQDGLVAIEAENYATSRTYDKQSWSVSRAHNGFAGSGAVVVEPDRGVRIRSRYNKRSPELTYPVYFTRTGRYYIWLRVWADDDESNSLHLGLDGEARRSASYIGTEIYGRWIWTRKQLDGDEYASLDITSAGTKDLNLWMREDGLYVDRIILTTDRYYAPSADGPAESAR